MTSEHQPSSKSGSTAQQSTAKQPRKAAVQHRSRRSPFVWYAAAFRAHRVRTVLATVIAALAVVALVIGALFGAYEIRLDREDRKALEEMRKTPVPVATGSFTGIDWDGLRGRNPDIYAWLTVPGTDVNMPVLQSPTDDSYYLSHNQWGEKSIIGAAFSEVQNAQSFTDSVTVIYGHDAAAVFKSLHNFEDRTFFDQHDTFTVYTPAKHRLTYRIISSYRTDDSHILNTHDFSKPDQIHDYFQQVMHPEDIVASNTRAGYELKDDARILQLSTCMLNEFHGSHRYIVTGALEHDETL